MVRACDQAGARCAGNIQNVIRIVISLRKIIIGVVPRSVTALPVVFAGGPATTGSDHDEVPAVAINPAHLLIGCPLERRPIRCRDVPLPGGYVNSQGPQLLGLDRRNPAPKPSG